MTSGRTRGEIRTLLEPPGLGTLRPATLSTTELGKHDEVQVPHMSIGRVGNKGVGMVVGRPSI